MARLATELSARPCSGGICTRWMTLRGFTTSSSVPPPPGFPNAMLFFFKGRSPYLLRLHVKCVDHRLAYAIRDRGSTFSSHLKTPTPRRTNSASLRHRLVSRVIVIGSHLQRAEKEK